MKTFKTILPLVLAVGLGVWAGMYIAHAADSPKPGQLTELEKNVLMRTELQLQQLQRNYQEQAKPIADEQQGVLKKRCGEVKATPGIDCVVDLNAGTVSKRQQTQTPTPPAEPPPAKK